jgi:hypothetical protein
MGSARRLKPHRFIEIMEMTCSFSNAKSTPGGRNEHTADPNDVRANLVAGNLSDDDRSDKDDGGYRGEERKKSVFPHLPKTNSFV